MSGRFVDFYVVLGVRADASQEEIWEAYNRKKRDAASLGQTAYGGASRDRLLELAIAVLGEEAKRLVYDFKGEGGTVDFEVNWQEPSRAEPPAAPAERQGTVPLRRSWEDYQGGAVIQGSNRMGAGAHRPDPAPSRPVSPEQPAPQAEQESPIAPGQPPVPAAQASPADGLFLGEAPRDDFVLRTTSNANGRMFEGQGYRPPRPYTRTERLQAEEGPLSQLLSKATFVLGLFFALLLSIAWMLELPIVGGFLPATETSALRDFLEAANVMNIVKLWVLLFGVGFLLWCAEVSIIHLGCGALDSSYNAMPSAMRGEAQKIRGRLLGAEIFLFLVLCAVLAIFPQNMNLIHDRAAMWEALYIVLSLLYFFIPLFLISKFAGKSAWSAVVWQVSLLLGHMIFVLLLEKILLGSTSVARYFTGGLFKFGYASWWVLFYFGYKWYVRMNAR